MSILFSKSWNVFLEIRNVFVRDKIILVSGSRWNSQLAPWIPVIRQTWPNIESLDWQPVSWSWHRGLEYPNTTKYIHSAKTSKHLLTSKTYSPNIDSLDRNQFSGSKTCNIVSCFHGGFVETCIFPFVCSNPELSLEFPWGPSTPHTLLTLFHKLSDLKKCF